MARIVQQAAGLTQGVSRSGTQQTQQPGVGRSAQAASTSTARPRLATDRPPPRGKHYPVKARAAVLALPAEPAVASSGPPPPPPLNPLHVPELLDLVLSFVAAGPFSAGLLRTNSLFYSTLLGPLYLDINLKSPMRRLTDLLDCLKRRDEDALAALEVRCLRFRLSRRKQAAGHLDKLRIFLADREDFASKLRTLEVVIERPVSYLQEYQVGSDFGCLVDAALGLDRLVLRGIGSRDPSLYGGLVYHLEQSHSAETLKNLSIELPAESFLPEAAYGGRLSPAGEIRTFFHPLASSFPSEHRGMLSRALLKLLLRCLSPNDDNDDPDGWDWEPPWTPPFKTLTLGPALVAWIDCPACGVEERKEWALAQRVVADKAADLGCTIVFPEGVDLGRVLDVGDPVYAALGPVNTLEQWEDGVWPTTDGAE